MERNNIGSSSKQQEFRAEIRILGFMIGLIKITQNRILKVLYKDI